MQLFNLFFGLVVLVVAPQQQLIHDKKHEWLGFENIDLHAPKVRITFSALNR